MDRAGQASEFSPDTDLEEAVAACADATPPVVDSALLLRGGRCVLISHRGAVYRLSSTRAGKLILTK